jgi:hypothetical protein
MLGKDDVMLAGDKAKLGGLSEATYASFPWFLDQARKELPPADSKNHLYLSFLRATECDLSGPPVELCCHQKSSRLLALREIQTLGHGDC